MRLQPDDEHLDLLDQRRVPPPDAIVSGSTCADYPVGFTCGTGFSQCGCTMCGPPAWYCF